MPQGSSKFFRKELHYIDGDTDYIVMEAPAKKENTEKNVKAENKVEPKTEKKIEKVEPKAKKAEAKKEEKKK